MNKKTLILLFVPLLLAGCVDPLDEGGNNNPSIDDNQGQQEGEHQQQSSEGLQKYTEVVAFSTFVESSNDYAIFANKFPAGSDFNNQTKKDQFKEFLDDQLDYLDLISSVGATNCHTQKYDSNTYFQLGSGSNAEGSFTWNSDVKIYKVEAAVLCYSKYNDYNQFYVTDSWSYFAIDDEDNDLTNKVDSDGKPLVVTYFKEYAEGTDSFSISSSLGRVYVKTLKITWRG